MCKGLIVMPNTADLRAVFHQKGQDHVFAGWDGLTPDERNQLLADCEEVDFSWIEARMAQARASAAEGGHLQMTPAPVTTLPRSDGERLAAQEARKAGEAALRAGKAAAFVVAGGQGSRLGFEGPKGCFPVGPVTGKTLFAWHAEQILALSRRYDARIPWYIMTSRDNDSATREYFAENHYLGLDRADVVFFRQSVVPSLTMDGKLIMSGPSRLAMNPDGHGGSLSALVKSGAVADMERRGVEVLSYFQVDNPLVTICDPVFLGYHLLAGAEMSSKVLDKNGPEEKVGHVCYLDGKLTVIEYSDMDHENMHARDAHGRLKFWAGSIAIHMLNSDFIKSVGGKARLPWHVAKKKIPYYADGVVIKPERENGLKFETFVFDALPLAKASVTVEVAREEEFAPVKNARGVDSAESCRRLMSNRFGRWLAECGIQVDLDSVGNAAANIEISPLYALDEEELGQKLGSRNLKVERTLALG